MVQQGCAGCGARFYAATFPDSEVTAIHKAPGDYPSGKEGEILTVEFTVCGIPCVGLNGGTQFKHSEAFSFQIATDTQEETDRYWNAIVSNGGQESYCGWCKDRWGISWQITPRVLTDAMEVATALRQSQRDCVLQPKVGESARLPWVMMRKRVQPQRGCGECHA
ncbi:MAG: VOC family protein [Limisphaerales bacterium]